MKFSRLSETEITRIKTEFAACVADLGQTYAHLRQLANSESVEILFLSREENVLYDKVKGTRIDLTHLADDSILGHAFLTREPFLSQDVDGDARYTLAIDNPFKITMRSQLVIPSLFQGEFEGVLRFSKSEGVFEPVDLEGIQLVEKSFREIFLNEGYLKEIQMQRHPFSLQTYEVYKAVKQVKSTYEMLMKHTENPEILKLLDAGRGNIDSVFEYLNPNLDNVSRVKNAMRSINKNADDNDDLKVLIADDVQMNVKIINSLLNKSGSPCNILSAYDGNQTFDTLKKEKETDHPVDVIFLDHHMPGKLGLEIAQTLKNDWKQATRIVSITNDPEAIEHQKELYDYTMSKPFAKSELDAILADIRQHREKCA